jgi:hypothetical protein
MDFGGILAGAMAGGGKAIQQNAQSQLEKQRKQALIELEQKRADQRAAATAQADAAQAAIDRQAELDRIAAEGDQERKTRERQAELDNQYGPGEDSPAAVQEVNFLAQNVTGGDMQAAADIAYSRNDFTRADAYKLVVDGMEEMPITERRNMTEEKLRDKADALYEYFSQRNRGARGGSRRAGQQSDRGGIFSFGSGGTLTETPSGGLTTLPKPENTPSVFQDN